MTTALVKRPRTTPEARPPDYISVVEPEVWKLKPQQIRRFSDWTVRLDKFLVDNAGTPHKWGKFDCALMAAEAIKAMTGVDIASDFRGYTTQGTAFAKIAKVTKKEIANVEDAAAYCAAKHGLKELKHPLQAQRGDLVVLEDTGRVIAGLVHLSGRHIVASGEAGLKRILIHDGKTSPILRAWRVPL